MPVLAMGRSGSCGDGGLDIGCFRSLTFPAHAQWRPVGEVPVGDGIVPHNDVFACPQTEDRAASRSNSKSKWLSTLANGHILLLLSKRRNPAKRACWVHPHQCHDQAGSTKSMLSENKGASHCSSALVRTANKVMVPSVSKPIRAILGPKPLPRAALP